MNDERQLIKETAMVTKYLRDIADKVAVPNWKAVMTFKVSPVKLKQ
jgi:hypothetical protein